MLICVNYYPYICIVNQGFSELHTTLILKAKTFKKVKKLAPTWCRGIFVSMRQPFFEPLTAQAQISDFILFCEL